MSEDPFALVGSTIEGKYRIDEIVGEGGFGVVYRGFHLTFDHPIAVKCLKLPQYVVAEAQKVFFEKFRDEGKLLSQLSSKNLAILRVYDFGVHKAASGAVPFLVLEWLDGASLEETLAERRAARLPPYSEREAIELLRPAIDAIGAAHAMNVAHRDIKPANLFVMKNPRGGPALKVLDFGIAKVMQEGDTAMQMAAQTGGGYTAFSRKYGAPEQFYAKRFGATGPWTDVHALGLCLVEMVTGKPALDGEEAQELFEAVTRDVRPTPRVRGGVVSDAFEAAVAKAIAIMPADRFANARALEAALQAIPEDAPLRGSAEASQARAAELSKDDTGSASIETSAWLASKSAPEDSARHVVGGTGVPASAIRSIGDAETQASPAVVSSPNATMEPATITDRKREDTGGAGAGAGVRPPQPRRAGFYAILALSVAALGGFGIWSLASRRFVAQARSASAPSETPISTSSSPIPSAESLPSTASALKSKSLLDLDTPGDEIVTDAQSFTLSGSTEPGAEASFWEGGSSWPLRVSPDGSFTARVPIGVDPGRRDAHPRPDWYGEEEVTVRATSDATNAVRSIRVERTKNAEASAVAWLARKHPLPFNDAWASPKMVVGEPVYVAGVVDHEDDRPHSETLVLKPDDCASCELEVHVGYERTKLLHLQIRVYGKAIAPDSKGHLVVQTGFVLIGPAPAPVTAPPNCNPNFTLDANGLPIPKPECIGR